MAFISTNPCLCSPCAQNTPSVVDCPEVDENCFDLCDITVLPTDAAAVGPCGKQGTLDVTLPAYNHTTTLCGDYGGTIIWSIASFDSTFFVEANMTTAGVLTWVTQDHPLPASMGQIVIKAECTEIGAFGVVFIGAKDLCSGVACDSPEVCNPCTGACEEQNGEIQVNQGTLIVAGNVTVNIQE